MSRYVFSLNTKSALKETRAGGKAANLARLHRSGFRVPPGFVISSLAFRHFLAHCGVENPSKRRGWSAEDLEERRKVVIRSAIPPKLSRSICRAYSQLEGRVAVRSSMVGEDTTSASFAGQLHTSLNIEGEQELLEAVKQCWASVFTWHLVKYANDREILSSASVPESFQMAVLVQRLVAAKAAGVAFSSDPISGQRCVVIEAVSGFGDVLVQGLVQPDRYLVDARGALAEIDAVNREAPILLEEPLLELAEIVRDLATRTKDPQDVEWVWDGTDFHLLQSRPITSLVGKRVYSNRMVSDMSPGLVKPLVYSTKTVSMAENVFGRMFTELIGPNDIAFSALAKRIHSRIYTDLTMLGELFERVGMPANFFEMISRDEQTEFRRPSITPGTLGAMFRLFRFAWNHSRPKDGIDALIQRHDRALEPYRRADWVSAEPGQLLAQFDRLLYLHGETQWSVLIGSMNMAVRNRLLNRLVSRQTEDVVPSDLIRGLIGLKALEPNAELRDVAFSARTLSESDRRVLSEEDVPAIRATLSGSEHGQALIRRMDAFLNRYGFLSANGTDFSGTPWCEDPALLWHSVGRLIASPNFFAAKDVEAVREETRIRVRAQLNWMQRQFFDRLLASTITYVDVRERTSFLMSEETYEMRRILLALGNHLVASGILRERDDVFYLTYDELRNLVETNPEVAVVQDLVDGRKAEMAADAQLELPDTLCGDHVLAQPILLADEQEYLVGISGSSGLAQGHACVVLDPTQAPTSLDRDMILVVPFTDVGWTPLFAGIGGIVAETGGQLSHTSIVAREYGLPAVVSIRGATQLIRDGQPLLVDGDRGRVYLRHLLDS